MNVRILTAATIVLASFATVASAADVSKSTLNAMGFGNMQQMSDSDGLAIRGKGTTASVWGESTANFRGQTSTNGYSATASWANAPANAHGANLSVAGTVKVYFNQVNGLSVSAKLGVAGGFSTASAH